ncbi:MAG: 4-(cytidine 5'-diphospho)-2-C-methyl-D-erythritol kinase [Candidatus Eiseniibacteriota bacterium]|nr:MAG: 4-(cytidine 5'-diphospho)-2-C-methyl-D-erythritol kinase [Candidatus Eisenbacteria bacterium]
MEGIRLQYRAFAKLNLFLDVVGKRADGYHDIRSLMVTVGLFDTLQFERLPSEVRLRCDYPDVPKGPENLCLKAALTLRERARSSAGVAITLEKGIPVASGLGGGSSDAACTLLGLNRLWELGLSSGELAEVAEGIGSDVPFFVRGGAQMVEGRGERLTPLEELPELWFVVVVPPARISSAQAYSAVRIELTRRGQEHRIKHLGTGLDADGVAKSLRNDLESGVMEICPEVRELKGSLVALGALGSAVSGSGPAVFGIAHDQTSASAIASSIERPGLSVFVVRTVQAGALEVDPD